MSSYLKMLFIVLKSRTNNSDKIPIYCKLSLGNTTSRFSTKIYTSENQWSQKKQVLIGKSVFVDCANIKLQEIKNKILSIEADLIRGQEKYSLEDILNRFFNRDTLPFRTLIEAYEYKHAQMVALEGIQYKSTSIRKARELQKVVQDFLKEEMYLNDIPINKVKMKFLSELETYLKSKRKLSTIHSNKIIQKLKSIMNLAFEFGVIDKPAFPNHKFIHQKIKIVFLKMDELAILEQFNFAQLRLNVVRDIFLFSAYTGLHYSDAMSLTFDNIKKGVDGKDWIVYTRQKTGVEIHIPILEKTKNLIQKFKVDYNLGDRIIPKISNQKINSYLKEIAEMVGIKKPLSHKIARKTFGSVLLYHDVPMKVVSKLMGHSSVLVTERHYADIELKKLGTEMDRVDKILK